MIRSKGKEREKELEAVYGSNIRKRVTRAWAVHKGKLDVDLFCASFKITKEQLEDILSESGNLIQDALSPGERKRPGRPKATASSVREEFFKNDIAEAIIGIPDNKRFKDSTSQRRIRFEQQKNRILVLVTSLEMTQVNESRLVKFEEVLKNGQRIQN